MLANQASKGCYKTYDAFIGVCTGIMEIEDRHYRGCGLQNMKYDTAWDLICTNTALISPCAYQMMRQELGGQTIRSIQYVSSLSVMIRVVIFILLGKPLQKLDDFKSVLLMSTLMMQRHGSRRWDMLASLRLWPWTIQLLSRPSEHIRMARDGWLLVCTEYRPQSSPMMNC